MNVLVIGDSCTDEFVYGEINRISPEAPVPVLQPVKNTKNGGMANNVYNNLLSIMSLSLSSKEIILFSKLETIIFSF